MALFTSLKRYTFFNFSAESITYIRGKPFFGIRFLFLQYFRFHFILLIINIITLHYDYVSILVGPPSTTTYSTMYVLASGALPRGSIVYHSVSFPVAKAILKITSFENTLHRDTLADNLVTD